jgi:hypothetical protein
MSLTDIQIKYGAVLAPPGYKKAKLLNSEDVGNVNPETETAVFLWFKQGGEGHVYGELDSHE